MIYRSILFVQCIFLSLAVCPASGQELLAGKVVKIAEVPLYPLPKQSWDNSIGDKFILGRTFHPSIKPRDRFEFSELPDTTNYNGRIAILKKAKRIKDSEGQDVGYLLTFYFPDDGKEIQTRTSTSGDLEGANSFSNIEVAEKKWKGKYLWLNLFPTQTGLVANSHLISPFEKVKVLAVRALQAKAPVEFTLLANDRDTVFIQCSLANEDTLFSFFYYPFGREFLEKSPDHYYRTDPISLVLPFGLDMTDDSTVVSRKLSSNYEIHWAGSSEMFTASIHGVNLGGFPVSMVSITKFPSVYDDILKIGQGLSISMKFDSTLNADTIVKLLIAKWGPPTLDDIHDMNPNFFHGLNMSIISKSWVFYTPYKPATEITFHSSPNGSRLEFSLEEQHATMLDEEQKNGFDRIPLPPKLSPLPGH